MSIFLKRGERGLLVGQTGSGKTQDAIFQLRNAPTWPVIIFDTKIEDAFFGIAEDDETIELVNSFDELAAIAKRPRKEWSDYILVRPEVWEVVDIDALDKYSQLVYQKFGACFIYYDELYNWHNNGKPGNGLIGLLTRGRSKGKTFLGSTQRPSWISRFCFTESQKFYLHQLIDERDRKTLDSMVPNFSKYKLPPKYHFYHFVVGEHDAPVLYAPVPYQKLDTSRIFKKKWL